MPTRNELDHAEQDVSQDQNRAASLHAAPSGRDDSIVDRVCKHLSTHVPVGETFTSASLVDVVSRHVGSDILNSLRKQGFVTRVSPGTYVHDGRLLSRDQGRNGKIRAYLAESLSPGEVFSVSDLVLAGLGSRRGIYDTLINFRRSGFLVRAGYGRYVVAQPGQRVVAEPSLTAQMRFEMQGISDGRTVGPQDFLHLTASRAQVSAVLEAFERAGMTVRVAPALYVRAGTPSVEGYVPMAERVRQRIRTLPAGETFSWNSEGLFDGLGSRKHVREAVATLVRTGDVVRVAWGKYASVQGDGPAVRSVVLTIKQQVLLQIEARVAPGEKFTAEVLDLPRPLNALHFALSGLNRDGVITRVSLGVYVRTRTPERTAKKPGKKQKS